jgi:hypothetical protein
MSVLALALTVAACGRTAPQASQGDGAPDPGYLAAPQLSGLSRGLDGSLSLTGHAPPSSQVRLASPAGARLETTADGRGDWTAPLGPVSEPVLYGLSAELNGRRVQAEGYVAIMPGAPTVALLRAGSGALVLDGAPPGLRLLAVDIDDSGATVVSGRALAGAPVRIMIDGEIALEAAASADGRFGLTLPKPLSPGLHRIEAVTAKGMAQTSVSVGAIPQPADGPYRAAPLGGGWRVDWITPGMGLQTTLLLALPESLR